MRRILLVFALCFPFVFHAQPSSIILLGNASFEDIPGHSRPPRLWFYCGQHSETPPDVQPITIFGHTPEAFAGNTYVGMVTRRNGTTEAIGQRLPAPLTHGQCYQWSIMAARSDEYISPNRNQPGETINHNQAVILRVWGGNEVCEHDELLAQSAPITNTEWRVQRFQLAPTSDHAFISLEAYYAADEPYDGNLLLDHASPILTLDCDTGDLVADINTVARPQADSEQELEDIFREHGPRIRYLGNDLQLERTYFQTEDHQFFISNPSLWLLMTALSDFPDKRVRVGIVTTRDNSFVDRRNTIRLAIREMGLSDEQLLFFRIKPKKRDRRPWFYTDPDAHLLFRWD